MQCLNLHRSIINGQKNTYTLLFIGYVVRIYAGGAEYEN